MENAHSAAAACDVFISGEGPVGSALALALSRQGLRVALRASAPSAAASAEPAAATHAAPPPTGALRSVGGSDQNQKPDQDRDQEQDPRAYALNAASVELLRELRVWDALPDDARTPVYDMWVQGDEASALRFSAWQQRVQTLAFIVDASELQRALRSAIGFAPHVQRVNTEPPSALRVLAEGRDATGPAALGVQTHRRDYGQRAVAARLVCDRSHAGLARQWFRSPDVLALLPLDRPEPGRSYALVWSLPEERAQALLSCDDVAFEQALAEATGEQAGPLRLAGPRAAWPLRLAQAQPLCGPGWVLVGDAAHVVHPLAGQGLNLGLADVASLSRVLQAREPWRALGDERLLRRHVRARQWPTAAMSALTDGLLLLFADSHPLARSVRNRGMNLLDRLSALKTALAARAMHS